MTKNYSFTYDELASSYPNYFCFILARILCVFSLFYNILQIKCCFWNQYSWWNKVDDNVLLGAMPLDANLDELKNNGVRAIINLQAETFGKLEEYKKLNISQLHLPTIDFTKPTLQNIKYGVLYIQYKTTRSFYPNKYSVNNPLLNQQIDSLEKEEMLLDNADVQNKDQNYSSNKVYVHCKAGKSRSTIVVLCWMIYSKQISRLEAQSILSNKRSQVSIVYNHDIVKEFEQHVKQGLFPTKALIEDILQNEDDYFNYSYDDNNNNNSSNNSYNNYNNYEEKSLLYNINDDDDEDDDFNDDSISIQIDN